MRLFRLIQIPLALTTFLSWAPSDAQTIPAGYPRTPWIGSCFANGKGNGVSCTINTPAGQEVVVETVTFIGASDASYDNVVLYLGMVTGGIPFAWANQIHKTVLSGAGHNYQLSQTVALYGDPLQAIFVSFATDGNNPTVGLEGTVYLSGYTVPVSAGS